MPYLRAERTGIWWKLHLVLALALGPETLLLPPHCPLPGNIHPIYVLHLLLLTTHCSHPFPQAARTLPSKTQSQGPREPLSGASRLWISCGTSPTNLKLPCSVLMRFPQLLDPPPQGPSGGQSWPQPLSFAHPLLQSLPGVLGLPPAPVASK